MKAKVNKMSGQSYISKEDLYSRFGITEIEELADDVRLNSVISQTSALIDSMVASRYKLPLKNKHIVLEDLAADIIRYKLYDIDPPEAVKKRYDDAMTSLDKLSMGRMQLNEPTGEESKANSTVYFLAKPRKFTDKILEQ